MKKKKIKSGKYKEAKKKGGNDGKQNKQGKQKYENKKRPAWMFKRPNDADLTKEWNGAKWYYCSTETGGKCHGVYRKHRPKDCKSFKPKTSPKWDKGKKGKSKKKRSDDGDDMDVIVAQEAVNDDSSPPSEDDDELMGGYESE